MIVDPVMGDYGKPYATYTSELCQEMKQLVEYADILTPNLTLSLIHIYAEMPGGGTASGHQTND